MILEAALVQDRTIARQLVRTWDPFFGRFGRLRDIQRAAIPPILDGRSVLACAPTAGGKTEAACAPLIERHLGRAESWTILYVSPTRALVNDLYERLCSPLERLSLRVARRTGDHKDSLSRPPNVLITTPESFDSMLCREKRPDGHLLACVSAVVLDEIHLLHGSGRGEQVRWLLERLRRLRRFAREMGWTRTDDLQIVGLSATVPAPEEVRRAYLPDGELVQLRGGREIEAVEIACLSPAVENALPAYIAALEGPEKILVFSNARMRVDRLAVDLRGSLESLGYVVQAHHGSLSQPMREAAERAVKEERKIVVFATSTLEIGVDIGDIDLVVLDGPAPDVPALLQRIGRGNRRTDRTRVMLCAGSHGEVIVQSAMLSAARESYLGPVEGGPQYAVARQQLASFIFQGSTRARRRATLRDLVTTCLPDVAADKLLDHLAGSGDLELEGDALRLGEKWKEAQARGEIHSNIEDRGGYAVLDESTGDPIASGVDYKSGKRLAIAGNLLDVRSVRDRRLEVRRATDPATPVGAWSYTSGAWVQGAGQPQTVRRHLGFEQEEWPVLLSGGGRAVVFHFGGGRRKALLQLLLARLPAGHAMKVTNWVLHLPQGNGEKPVWLTEAGPATLDVMLAQRVDRLERALARPASNKALPLEMRLAEVRAWLRLEEQLRELSESRWIVQPESDRTDALRHLLRDMK